MRHFLKRTPKIVEPIAIADINRTPPIQSQVVDVLRKAQQPVEFHRSARPPRNRLRQLFRTAIVPFRRRNRTVLATSRRGMRIRSLVNARAFCAPLGSPTSNSGVYPTRSPM